MRRYEDNITMESTFLTNFKGAYDHVVLYISKSYYRLQQFENEKIFERLKFIQPPRSGELLQESPKLYTSDADNRKIYEQCSEWLFRNKKKLMNIRKHIVDLCKAQIFIKMIKKQPEEVEL